MIFCADIHLQHKPPIARSSEEDWYKAMARPLKEMEDLSIFYNIPVVCAGDIFDKWNSPPELINFAIKNLPRMYAVPGQHDLPFHRYEDIYKSAFWTLVEVGKIIPIYPDNPLSVDNIRLHGFPWSWPLNHLSDPHDLMIEVAVVHDYIYTKLTGYPTAPKSKSLINQRENLKGYDISFWGDNHNPFIFRNSGQNIHIINCGSLMRRTTDQVDYKPAIYLLSYDGSVKKHYLDISKDQFIDNKKLVESLHDKVDLEEFINELSQLGDIGISFSDTVRKMMTEAGVSREVEKIILKALEVK